MNFTYVLALAFIGGMILNIMPCVLPVISLKMLSLVKIKKNSISTKLHILMIVAGIITSFIMLAIIMSFLKSIGHYAGLGFSFQQPIFIISLILILVFFACNINQSISIDLPYNIKTYLSKYSDESKLIGSFLSGAFVTILATPCTAPFLGAAISFAFTLNVTEIIIVFIFIGIGMSMPFILLYLFPRTVEMIPSPGPWLIQFNKFIEILIYLTIMWLFWIIFNQIGLIASIVLFLFSILFKFILEKGKEFHTTSRMVLTSAIILGSFAITLNVEHNFQVVEDKIEARWKDFSIARLDKALTKNNMVLVDITAEWCLTCKYNKLLVLDTAFMLELSRKHNITLLRGDYTSGNKEIEIFLSKYNQYGIPFNVILNQKHPKGIVLPTILTISDIRNAIKKIQK